MDRPRKLQKRIVKMPKLYFYDVGLASWLLGIRTVEHITTHPLRGALFETFIISELIKLRLSQGERPNLYFWRDSNCNELDVIEERAEKLRPIEIKSGKTLSTEARPVTSMEISVSLAGWNAQKTKKNTQKTVRTDL